MIEDSIFESLLELDSIRALAVGKRLDGEPFDAMLPDSVTHLAERAGSSRVPRQARQVHGDDIDLDGSLDACDAFLVRAGESALVRHADCFPVVVADPVAGLAVVAHCGWKGVALELAAKSVRQLLSLGSRISDLSAAVGPGIGPASFEVGPDVLQRFPSRFHAATSWGTPSVDLPSCLRAQLESSGVRPERVVVSGTDTFRAPEWHSFRRERDLSGRNATLCIVSHRRGEFPPIQPRRTSMKRILTAAIAGLAIQAPVHALVGIGVSGGINTTAIDAAHQTVSGGDLPAYFAGTGASTPSLTLHREEMSSTIQVGVKAWLELPLLPVEFQVSSNLLWGNYHASLKYEDGTQVIDIPVDIKSPIAGFGEEKGATPYVGLVTDATLRYPLLKFPPALNTVKLYVGAGVTHAMASRVIDKDDIKETFKSASGEFKPSEPEKAKGVIEDELFQSTFGGHLVAGAQVKIPILPFALFVDGKWYLNTAVSEAASNYPFSVSAGIGFAL